MSRPTSDPAASGKLTGHRTIDRTPRHSGPAAPAAWLKDTDHSPGVIAFLRRARRVLPGDPHFGDRLSTTGSGGFEVAAHAADRVLGGGDAASREVRLGALQVWHALRERVTGRPAHEEVTLVFTNLVGFL